MSTPLNAEDVARRLTTKATIENVLRDPLTEDFGQGLKAAQITLAIEGQIASIIAATRTAALEEAALALIGHIGIQTTNGIGWIPGDSLAGAARYLRHLARAAKDGKR